MPEPRAKRKKPAVAISNPCPRARGGKNRRKREAPATAPSTNGSEGVEEAAPEEAAPAEAAPAEAAPEENWDYVPMSQWGDEIEG
jgi:hypothetical protein